MKSFFLILLTVFCITEVVSGQYYSNHFRPPEQNWQMLKNDPFRIIFPEGYDSLAYRSARILESQYPHVQRSVGGNLNNFPVVLNTMNDRSNGFVSPFNFRTEIEVPPIKGKAMNPRSGDWLELVLPHELVHALHLSVNPPGLTSVLGLLSPDLRRSIHMAAPLGILEGVAVDHESHHAADEGGRGNYPFFTHRFHTTVHSGKPWSMGQLFHVSARTLPFDRHYTGSYQFFRWLQNRHGDDTAKKAIEFHYQWPFLGFGMALRNQTGQWPRSLYRLFLNDMERQEEERLSGRETTTDLSLMIDHGRKGAMIRRPLWIDNQKVLMHGSFYNAPTGFYLYNTDDLDFDLVLEHRSVEDYRYSYDSASGTLHFADYLADGRYNTYQSALWQYNIRRGNVTRVTDDTRLFAPSPGETYLALQTAGSANRLVAVETADSVDEESEADDPGENPGWQKGESITVIAEPDGLSSIIEVQQHPGNNDLLAVIARRGPVQALWISGIPDVNKNLDSEPDIVFEQGSVFDLSWHQEENKLLFTSDHTGTMDIYEFDLDNSRVKQITQSLHNAFEASYSPDGSRIAYIVHQNNRYLPAILEHPDYLDRELPDAEWRATSDKTDRMTHTLPDQEEFPAEEGWNRQPYRTSLSWLKPRTVLPAYSRMQDGSSRLGIHFLSTDLLGRHTYALYTNHVYNRYWHDLTYTYSGFHPGIGFRLFNRPGSTVFRGAGSEDEPFRLLTQDSGVSIHIPYRYTFERNTRLTSITARPEYRFSRMRFLNPDNTGSPLSEFESLHTLSLNIIFNFRIRQFIRDLQPNAGWILFGQTDYDLNDFTFGFNLNEVTFANTFENRKGLRAGLYRYLAPLGKWNQSLRIGMQILAQTEFGQYDTRNVVSDAFSGSVFPGANTLGLLDTRYTIPLAYPDDGGLLIPAYISNIYLVLFSQTVSNLNSTQSFLHSNSSRTVVGAGIRSGLRLSNLGFDLGIGFGYEPARNQWRFILGQF